MVYRVREVDGDDEEIADILHDLHVETFGHDEYIPEFDNGHWWLAWAVDGRREIAGFCGLTKSQGDRLSGYLKRAGVLRPHRGQGLQRRFVRVREARARRNGWTRMITDTTDNPSSANNLIKCGYRIFTPVEPWFRQDTIYWEKSL